MSLSISAALSADSRHLHVVIASTTLLSCGPLIQLLWSINVNRRSEIEFGHFQQWTEEIAWKIGTSIHSNQFQCWSRYRALRTRIASLKHLSDKSWLRLLHFSLSYLMSRYVSLHFVLSTILSERCRVAQCVCPRRSSA